MKLTAEEALYISNTTGWTELLQATATIFTASVNHKRKALVSTNYPDSLAVSFTDLGYSVDIRGNILIVRW